MVGAVHMERLSGGDVIRMGFCLPPYQENYARQGRRLRLFKLVQCILALPLDLNLARLFIAVMP